jgi:hypothetical protein
MKTIITTTAALALMATAAFADGPFCEREITIFHDGQLVQSSSLPFYAHGCDRFQHQPLSPQHARNLIASGNCDVESYATGEIVETEITEEVEILRRNGHSHRPARFETVVVGTVETFVDDTRNWTDANAQPGPRSERCGFPGEVIAALQ